MMERIAIDQQLSNVREYLEANGYETIDLEEEGLNADVIIVSGMDTDYLGDADTFTEASIIDAAGLSEDEVLEEVEKKLRLMKR